MEKIKSYLGLANNAGYLIIGSDNLKNYSKKLYLVLIDKTAQKNSQKQATKYKNLGIDVFEVENLAALSNLTNCKIVGIKNKGISDQIKNILIKEN